MMRVCRCSRHIFHMCAARSQQLGAHAVLGFLEYHIVDSMFRSAFGSDATHYMLTGVHSLLAVIS